MALVAFCCREGTQTCIGGFALAACVKLCFFTSASREARGGSGGGPEKGYGLRWDGMVACCWRELAETAEGLLSPDEEYKGLGFHAPTHYICFADAVMRSNISTTG